MSIALVKQLRDETGAGLADCQKAVTEAAGDVDKARRILREKGLAKAAKKATRAATDGAVGAYETILTRVVTATRDGGATRTG